MKKWPFGSIVFLLLGLMTAGLLVLLQNFSYDAPFLASTWGANPWEMGFRWALYQSLGLVLSVGIPVLLLERTLRKKADVGETDGPLERPIFSAMGSLLIGVIYFWYFFDTFVDLSGAGLGAFAVPGIILLWIAVNAICVFIYAYFRIRFLEKSPTANFKFWALLDRYGWALLGFFAGINLLLAGAIAFDYNTHGLYLHLSNQHIDKVIVNEALDQGSIDVCNKISSSNPRDYAYCYQEYIDRQGQMTESANVSFDEAQKNISAWCSSARDVTVCASQGSGYLDGVFRTELKKKFPGSGLNPSISINNTGVVLDGANGRSSFRFTISGLSSQIVDAIKQHLTSVQAKNTIGNYTISFLPYMDAVTYAKLSTGQALLDISPVQIEQMGVDAFTAFFQSNVLSLLCPKNQNGLLEFEVCAPAK